MEAWKEAVEYVLAREGGFVSNDNDSGGATNFGISLRFLRSVHEDRLRRYAFFVTVEKLTAKDIESLTREQAEIIYKGEFWDVARFGDIANDGVRNYVFDCTVLHGLRQGIKILQRAMWGVLRGRDLFHDDGVLGDVSIQNVNILTKDKNFLASLTTALITERAGFCRLLAAVRPKDEVFLDGWLSRCYRWA